MKKQTNQTKPSPIYSIYIYIYVKQDLPLNYQQWLICHKTKPNLLGFKNEVVDIIFIDVGLDNDHDDCSISIGYCSLLILQYRLD